MAGLCRGHMRIASCFHRMHVPVTKQGNRIVRPRLPFKRQRTGLSLCASAATEETASVPDVAQERPVIEKIDLRVGKILSAEAVPEADELYIEKVDLGEGEPRTILSGLKKYVAVEDLQDRMVVVVANLPARKLVGIPSQGMLLCASNQDHSVVEPLLPPSEATVGERVFFGSAEPVQGEAASPNQVKKKKFWEKAQPQLKTNADKVPNFDGQIMLTSQGPVTSSLENANIS